MTETEIHDKIMSQIGRMVANFHYKYRVAKIYLNSESYSQLLREISEIKNEPIVAITEFLGIPLVVDDILVPRGVAFLVTEETEG